MAQLVRSLLLFMLAGLNGLSLAHPTNTSCIHECLERRQVPAFFEDDPAWTNLTTPFNLRLQYAPAAVVTADNTRHVSNAVKCASRCGIKVC